MDKLAKIFFKNPDPVYKYKEKVDVPVLGMVDDVLSVTKDSKKKSDLKCHYQFVRGTQQAQAVR